MNGSRQPDPAAPRSGERTGVRTGWRLQRWLQRPRNTSIALLALFFSGLSMVIGLGGVCQARSDAL